MKKINVAGAGLSGLAAAISLAEKGFECFLISQQPSERAQSVLAEGGINAVLNTMGEEDTIAEHFSDTMKGGAYLADPNAVWGLVSAAPEIVDWLMRIGVPFQKENGHVVLRNFGGQKKKRTAYSKSSTGKMIMSALIDEARKYEAMGRIVRLSHHEVTDLIFSDDNCCLGVQIRDIYTGRAYFSEGRVILASGGLNGLFSCLTTGAAQNTGDLTALAFRKGVKLANLEFIQYHPTTVSISGKRMLISEAARGEGGRLYVLRGRKPWYFMEELYPALGNLMPRDVISHEMVSVCARDDCGDNIYLDLTGLSDKVWDKKLSDMRKEIIAYLSVDPAVQPIQVGPGIHFFMGGIHVDEKHRTNIKGLYAAGECSCQYHGANRLGGNSLLGAIYGGKIAADTAAAEYLSPLETSCSSQSTEVDEISHCDTNALRNILAESLGIVRCEQTLSEAIDKINILLSNKMFDNAEINRFLLGKAMLLSALERKESRGAHFRSDYPVQNDADFKKTTVCSCNGGILSVEFEEIPERRADL